MRFAIASFIKQALSLSALAMLVLSGCSSAPEELASEAKIYGGTPVTGTKWASSVALVRGSIFCTGTLVHPQLVISAAHCLDNAVTSSGSTIKIVVGNESRSGQSYAVEKININPAYRDDAVTDWAYLKLATPITNVEIIPVLTDPEEIRALLASGTKSWLVGFGTTEAGVLGTKYEAETKVGPSEGGALFIGGGGKDTCQGDSGGPAYGQLPNGQFRVYGITSRGNGCGGGGTYARMHDGLCFIQKDSGITIPGSKLNCPGVPNIPAEGGGAVDPQPGKDLRALLVEADAATPGDHGVALAAPRSLAKVVLCKGDKAACLASKREDLVFQKHTKETTDLAFHVSTAKLRVEAGAAVTLLGFDASGKVVQANTIRFERL